MSPMHAVVLGSLAVGVAFALIAVVVYGLNVLNSRRTQQATTSSAYSRAGQVKVLPGSPVARNYGRNI